MPDSDQGPRGHKKTAKVAAGGVGARVVGYLGGVAGHRGVAEEAVYVKGAMVGEY